MQFFAIFSLKLEKRMVTIMNQTVSLSYSARSEEVGHGSKSIMVAKRKTASFATDRRSGTISRDTLRGGKIQGALIKERFKTVDRLCS